MDFSCKTYLNVCANSMSNGGVTALLRALLWSLQSQKTCDHSSGTELGHYHNAPAKFSFKFVGTGPLPLYNNTRYNSKFLENYLWIHPDDRRIPHINRKFRVSSQFCGDRGKAMFATLVIRLHIIGFSPNSSLYDRYLNQLLMRPKLRQLWRLRYMSHNTEGQLSMFP